MKTFYFFVLALVIIGCSEDDSSATNENDNNDSVHTIYTNPSSPILLSSELESNETLEVYGTRNTNGIPTSINQMTLRNEANEETIYLLDETGKLDYIKAYDGSVLKLDWLEGSIKLTVISASKDIFFETILDLNEALDRKSIKDAQVSDNGKFSGETEHFLKHNSQIAANNSSYRNSNNNNVQVNVKRCGELSNYEGIVRIEVDFGDYDVTNYFSTLSETGIGQFSGCVEAPLPPITSEDFCNAITPIAEGVCQIYNELNFNNPNTSVVIGDTICAWLTAYLLVAPPAAGTVGAICIALNSFFSIVCPIIPGAVELACLNASNTALNFITNQIFPIRAVLTGPDGNFQSEWIEANLSQTIQPIDVSLMDSYSHLVKISAPLLDCSSNWNAFVDDVNLGPLSSENPVFTTVPNGEHTIYLSDGIEFTDNWTAPISFPCEGFKFDVQEFSFNVACEPEDNEIDLSGSWYFLSGSLTGTFTQYSSEGNTSGETTGAPIDNIVFNDDGSLNASNVYTGAYSLGTNSITISAEYITTSFRDIHTFNGTWDESTGTFTGTYSRNSEEYASDGSILIQTSTYPGQTQTMHRY